MPVTVTEQVREAVMRRRNRGRGSAIELRVKPVYRGGSTLTAEWVRHGHRDSLVTESPEGIRVYIDAQIARYAAWHTIGISAGGLGPIEYLTVDDPLALFKIGAWKRSHPDPTVPARGQWMSSAGISGPDPRRPHRP